MKGADISKITRKGKSLLLAYDQGLEHGPKDFSGRNMDPSYILEIAKKGGFTGVILQKGVAEKYYAGSSGRVPLVLKLNGKTSICKGEPVSLQVCSVREAIGLGAAAVGYTIYVGSAYESKMFREFGSIEEEAHDHGVPVIAWMYPRGRSVKKLTPQLIAYAARAGLELGADFVKVKYTGSADSFRQVVGAAGRCGVLCLGGSKMPEKRMLQQASDAMKAGAAGMAVGRNVWQHREPLKMSKAIASVVFDKKTPAQALKILKR
jgi:class I fructose-bisphosphate aldolase